LPDHEEPLLGGIQGHAIKGQGHLAMAMKILRTR